MNNDNDYANLLKNQSPAYRTLRIKKIDNDLLTEKKEKNAMAITSGICFSGLLFATYFSRIDPNQAITTEIQTLSSLDYLKNYLSMITPAMCSTMIATAISIAEYIKHNKKYSEASREFKDITDSNNKSR